MGENNLKKENIISVIKIIILLCGLSLSLFLTRRCILLFVNRTDFSDHMASMIAMMILAFAGLIFCRKQNIKLSVFPAKFSTLYVVATLVGAVLFILTPSNYTDGIHGILLLLFSSIVTPVFEELIFRGYVWNKLNEILNKEWKTFFITTCLFALWHIGYIDSIAFRVDAGLLNAMMWKVITGLIFGIILGLVRMKSKNCYSTILVHGIMNIFGR